MFNFRKIGTETYFNFHSLREMWRKGVEMNEGAWPPFFLRGPVIGRSSNFQAPQPDLHVPVEDHLILITPS